MTNKEWARATIASLVTIPHDGDLVSWSDGRLKIPYSTQYPIYMADVSPWLIEPMKAVTDPKVKRVDVRMPAGAAKSLIGEIAIAYTISEEPRMTYYVWQTDDDAKDANEDRITPMIEANDFLSSKMPTHRSKNRSGKIIFPGMSLYFVGANESAAQSKRVGLLIMEEPHTYTGGIGSAMVDRTKGVRNPKILTLSTGSILGDESDEEYNKGSCHQWQVPCPHCGEYQVMTDSRDRLLSKIDDETQDENGEYIWSKIMPTVRYNCEKCFEDWPVDSHFRHEQAKKGKYVATNLNAPDDHRSYHMEAVSIYYDGFDLGTILKQKLSAVAAYKRGAIEPFKNYMQKQRAMAWDDSPPAHDEQAAWDRTKGEYGLEEPHEFEISRFLCIDNQAGKASQGQGAHRWAVCRSFGPTECRLIYAGRVTSWEEVEELRVKLGVEPGRTWVDIAFDTAAVQAVCVRFGWKGFWGDSTGKKSFPHIDNVMMPTGLQRVVRQYPWSTPNIGHVGIGTSGERRQAVYYFWCQTPIKDMWHRLKGGLTSYRWTVAQDTSEEYRKQTNTEFKKQVVEKKTGRKSWAWISPSHKDDHMKDCDQMCLVAGLMDLRIRELLWSGGNEEIEQQEDQQL